LELGSVVLSALQFASISEGSL